MRTQEHIFRKGNLSNRTGRSWGFLIERLNLSKVPSKRCALCAVPVPLLQSFMHLRPLLLGLPGVQGVSQASRIRDSSSRGGVRLRAHAVSLVNSH